MPPTVVPLAHLVNSFSRMGMDSGSNVNASNKADVYGPPQPFHWYYMPMEQTNDNFVVSEIVLFFVVQNYKLQMTPQGWDEFLQRWLMQRISQAQKFS